MGFGGGKCLACLAVCWLDKMVFFVKGSSGKQGYAGYKLAGLFLGPLLFLCVLLAPTPEGMSAEAQRAGAVASLMAVWWIFEAIPLPATALAPLALFPLLGVISAGEASAAYGDSNIFLFAGGFFIAMAMQKWNLHERIALQVVKRTGSHPQALVGGFMLATAFLSMWISNTATALMMLPIALAVVEMVAKNAEGRGAGDFAVCVLLGIAYSASIGGVATLIGTPPNGVLLGQFKKLYPEAGEIGFLQWMLLGFPLVAVLLPLTWCLLTKFLFRFEGLSMRNVGRALENRLRALGPMHRGEKIVLAVWAATAAAWIFRSDVVLGSVASPPAELKRMNFDHVMANPPFFAADEGLQSPDGGRRSARHESVPLESWVDCALRRLRPEGELTMILPPGRFPDFLSAIRERAGSINVKPLYSRIGRPASRFLIRTRKGARGPLSFASPLVLHESDAKGGAGAYSEKTEALLRSPTAIKF